jgi:predicted RNase H-like HicB family nuclease
MATVWYPAIIESGDKRGFSVFFPDFPGCVSAGATEQETAAGAIEALRLHVRGMLADGDPIPQPTPLDQVDADPEVREAARILVPADLPGKALRINISMDEGLVEQVDRAASKLGMTRSAFLAAGARKLIDDAA